MATQTTNYSFDKPTVGGDGDAWGALLNGNWNDADSLLKTRTDGYNFADQTLERAEMIDTSEAVHTLGNVSGAVAIDYTDGQWQYATVTGNITGITVSNWPVSGKGAWLTLELIQDGTGSRTLALSSAYRTVGGGTITLSTAGGSVDKLRFESRDAGTTIDTFANLGMA